MNTATETPVSTGTELDKQHGSDVVSQDDQPTATDRAGGERKALRPPVDVIEDSSGITLFADMPGDSKDRLDLKLDGDELVIEGEMTLSLPEQMSANHAEMQMARYRRNFALSKELDRDNIQADFRQGVLKLRIPKAKHAQPRKIPISVS